MQLRPSLFWDMDIQTVDLEKHKAIVIERILTRGRWEEAREMLAFYGKKTVKQVVLEARYLDKYTLAFCCAIFNIPKTEFRCYKLAQLNPQLWDF